MPHTPQTCVQCNEQIQILKQLLFYSICMNVSQSVMSLVEEEEESLRGVACRGVAWISSCVAVAFKYV
jgi:hypothetical protein